jgi:hypothetical protein
MLHVLIDRKRKEYIRDGVSPYRTVETHVSELPKTFSTYGAAILWCDRYVMTDDDQAVRSDLEAASSMT